MMFHAKKKKWDGENIAMAVSGCLQAKRQGASEAVVDGSIDCGFDQAKIDNATSELSKLSAPRTFISHAGENKSFVRELLVAIEQQAKVAAFFDDDMAVGTSAEDDMITRAAEADQGIVVISRPFLTKEWPMKELNLFLENGVKIFPLYYHLSLDDLRDIIAAYDRKAGYDEPAFREKMRTNPIAWRTLMEEIARSFRYQESSGLPDPLTWRHDVGRLARLTGLRRKDFENDEPGYVEACANMVSPPGLPDTVPPLPDHYVKSPFIDDVMSTVLDHVPNSEPSWLVLTGMGGAGKTVAASAVARNDIVRRHFNDGVLWMHGEIGEFNEQRFVLSLNKLAEQFRHLVLSRHYRQGHAFQYDKADFQTVRDAQRYFSMWQKKFNLRCLLVVDNGWNVEVLENVGTMGFDILVTTRQKDTVPTSPGWRSLEVPEMNEKDSLLLLASCSGTVGPVPREPALQVAKDCAFLPFALAIAGSTLGLEGDASSAHSWRKLHEKFKDKAGMQTNKGNKQDSLNAVLAVSFGEMGRRQRGHFLELAVLAYDVIAPKEMLRHLWEEQDLADAKVIARDLVTRSLMQVRGDGYAVHDLVLDFAKFRITDFELIRENAISRQAQYLGRLDVIRTYAEDRKDGAGYYWLIALWRSVEELHGDIGLEEKTYKNSLRPLEESEASSAVAQAYCDVARLFDLQQKYGDAGPLYQQALKVDEEVYGPTHLAVASDLMCWGRNLHAQGKFPEARLLLARATKNVEEMLGPENPAVAAMLSDQVFVLLGQGENDKAELLMDRVHAIRAKAFGPDHPQVLDSIINRAFLLKAQGRYSEADHLCVRVIEIGEHAVGPDHPGGAALLDFRAGLLIEQEEAERLYFRALDINEKSFGKEHPSVSYTLSGLAGFLREQGKYDESDRLYQKALAIDEKAFGLVHPRLVNSLTGRAELLSIQGKYEEADLLYQRALKIQETAFSPNHQGLANTLSNRAGVLEKQGRYEEADQHLTRAIEIAEKTLGSEHPNLATKFSKRALFMRRQGKYAEAELAVARATEVWEKAFGPGHPSVASGLNNRATLLREQGKYDEADSLYLKAIAIDEKVYGPDHPNVARGLNNRAELLMTQRKFDEADPLYQRALAIDEKVHGPDHPDVARDLSGMSMIMGSKGEYAEAERLNARAAEIYEKALGSEYPDMATVLHQGAMLLTAQGKHGEAYSSYQRALAINEKVYGSDHPIVARDLYNMSMILRSKGEYAEAERLIARAAEIYEKSLGPEHPGMATIHKKRVNLLVAQRKFDEADQLYARAIAIEEKTLGPEHLSVAKSRDNRASLMLTLGKYDEAQALFDTSMPIWKKTHDPNHPDLAVPLYNRAFLLRAQYDEADPMYARAIAIREKALGPGDSLVIKWRHYRASLLKIRGKHAEAQALYEKTTQFWEETDPDHLKMASALNNLADSLKAQGKYDEADQLRTRAMAIEEKTSGPERMSVARSHDNRANLILTLGKFPEAQDLFDTSKSIWKKTHDPDSTDLAVPLYDRAFLLRAQGKYDEADLLYSRAIAIREKALDPGDSMILEWRDDRASLLNTQGKHAEAQALYEKITQFWEETDPDHLKMASALNNLANSLKAQAQYSEAIPLLEKALAIREAKLGEDDEETMATKRSLRDARAAQVGSQG